MCFCDLFRAGGEGGGGGATEGGGRGGGGIICDQCMGKGQNGRGKGEGSEIKV